MKLLLLFGAAILAVSMAESQTVKVSGNLCCMTPQKDSLLSEQGKIQTLQEQDHFKFRQIEAQVPLEEAERAQKICDAPGVASIELWHHSSVFSDTLFHAEKFYYDKRDYSFEWKGDKVGTIKPLLKVHMECQDGRTLDRTYEYFDKTNIEQDIIIN